MSVAVMEPPASKAPTLPPKKITKPVKTFRNAQGLRIENAILHIVDHRKGDQPVLSDAGLLLADGTLVEYLLAQIRHALEDTETTDARFMDENHAVAVAARRILADPASFIDDSKFLAQALWNATGTNKSISPGSLIVSRFWAENHREPFLAMLKIDPTNVFLQTVSRSGEHVIVGLRLVDDALPAADVRLQKAVLIAPQGYAKYDMLLLDRLVSKPAAEFFAKKFLNVKPIPTSWERAKRLHYVYTVIKNRFDQPGEPSTTKAERDILDSVMDQALQGKRVDVVEMVAGLNVSEPVRERLLSGFKEELDTLAFEVDPAFAAEKLLKKKFRGGYGIVVEFYKQFEASCYFEGPTYMEGKDKITEITLKVPNLEWVK